MQVGAEQTAWFPQKIVGDVIMTIAPTLFMEEIPS